MNITKEEALKKIEELKKYVDELDIKKEEKVIGIAIKNRFTGSIIFQSTKTTFKEAVTERLQSDANLRGANLRDADLSGAELQNAKFYGRGGIKELTKAQLPNFLRALGFVIVE